MTNKEKIQKAAELIKQVRKSTEFASVAEDLAKFEGQLTVYLNPDINYFPEDVNGRPSTAD